MNKKGLKSKTLPKAITKRVGWMQKFFDELQRDKKLRSADFFSTFFSLKEKSAFEKSKKEISKLPSPKDVPEIKHFDGIAQVGVSAEKVLASRNISSYVPNCQSLYDKLAKANEETVKAMRFLEEAFIREADVFRELSLAHAAIQVYITNLFL